MKEVEPKYQGYCGFLALRAFLLLRASSGDMSCNKELIEVGDSQMMAIFDEGVGVGVIQKLTIAD